MTLTPKNTETEVDDWSIPGWIKIVIVFFACSVGAIFVLARLSPQEALFGLPTRLISIASIALVLPTFVVAVAFWRFPGHPFSVSVFWLIRFLREFLWLLALIGILLLITLRVPLFSIRGGLPLINLLLLFWMGITIRPVHPDHPPLSWMERIVSLSKRWIARINSMPAWLIGIMVASLPILIICFVIYFGLDVRLSDYGPYSFWNDETGYWVWIRSFAHVGLSAGYNAPNELIARAAFNHYGEGSPFYIYIYGTIARITGWLPYLPILINFVFLSVATLLFIRFAKLEPVQILFVGLITLLTWPVLLYLPMTTHETLNQAIGFVLAILFFRLLTQRERLHLPVRILFIVLFYFAALIRLSWGLLLIPVIFYSLNGSILRRVFLSIVLGLALFVSVVMITSYLVPPTNNSIMASLKDSLVEGPQAILNLIPIQFRLMFKFNQLNPNMAVMLQIAIITVWSLVRLFQSIKLKLSPDTILHSPTVFDLYNVTSLAVAGLLFYLQEGFYRTFTPSLLIVFLLLITRRDYRFLITLLTVSVIFFHSYMTYYAFVGDAQIIKTDYTTDFPERPQLVSDVEKWIVFDQTAQNPWCNTLLIPLGYYDYRLTVIPPGIGISYILDIDNIEMPLKSKYLLFDEETYTILEDRLDAKLLTSLSIGNLYYNQSSGCTLNQ